jgi:hypothetical protein
MRAGQPFKSRGTGRPYPGILLTPDILKFKIPSPFAFVPVNPKYNPRSQQSGVKAPHHSGHTVQSGHSLVSQSLYQNNSNCQAMVQNFNKCIKNNNLEACQYYFNYLSSNCTLKK